MPLLDVSEILSDPEFADSFDIERRVSAVDSSGRATESVTTLPGLVGVVTSDAGANLMRSNDARRASGSIMVHTATLLYSGEAARDADIVVWAGQRYTVTAVDNYSRFGAGFCAARCELQGVA